ncbi:chromophore lyase CpcT/CpeT [Lewinella sp. W8]|uniref:chromophore lyase CpcT/CpeT n=1 Tax=Lewinella sp. W8 TaxID=2528208 RepID=UPI001566069F|nr:chromophore lyase CpcT/CpeT [Lewinella sp. W8]
MTRIFSLLFLASVLLACNTTKVVNKVDVMDLRTVMTGSFDSSLQASVKEDYYNIVLHMEPIWLDKPGNWLYVEQAVAATADEPYRQRIYKLEQTGTRKFVSRVFEMPDPERFIGAYDDPDLLNVIGPEQLTEREGCAVHLKYEGEGTYRGSTKKDKCKSSLRGATYATSRVSITRAFVQSWDQGFNAEDEQVWGATEGGYMFMKQVKE